MKLFLAMRSNVMTEIAFERTPRVVAIFIYLDKEIEAHPRRNYLPSISPDNFEALLDAMYDAGVRRECDAQGWIPYRGFKIEKYCGGL